MNAPKKRSAPATWKAIEDAADEDEALRILSLSDADLDAELTAAGFDIPTLDATNTAFIAEAQRTRDLHAVAAG